MEWSGGEKQLYKAINWMESLFMNSKSIIFLFDLSSKRHTHARTQRVKNIVGEL